MKRELKIFGLMAGVFLLAYFVPFSHPTVRAAISEGLLMLQEYARDHVLLCLVPAFFIAGAIAVFVSQASVIKYLGIGAKRVVAYGVSARSPGRSSRSARARWLRAVCRDLQAWCWPRPGDCVPLIRPGDQHPCDHLDRADPRNRVRSGSGDRGGRVLRGDRALDAVPVPQRRGGEGAGRRGAGGARRGAADLEDGRPRWP